MIPWVVKIIIWISALLATPQGQFSLGYDLAGHNLEYKSHFEQVVIPCESKWNQYAVNEYSEAEGLAQFLPSTWYSVASITGLWDWTDPIHQGFNASVWTTQAEPESQWIGCW